MSHAIKSVVLAALVLGASDVGYTQVPPGYQAPASIVSESCLDPDAERLNWHWIGDYLRGAEAEHDRLAKDFAIPPRHWFRKHVLDRTTFELSYGDNYKLRPGDEFVIDTDSEGASWDLTYKLPLSVFGQEQEKARERKTEAERVAESRLRFRTLLFDFKAAVAKYDEGEKLASELAAAEKLAIQIASVSPLFATTCLTVSL